MATFKEYSEWTKNSRWSKRAKAFLSCESGATTSDYVIIASVVVALGVSAVLATGSGAQTTTRNTVTAMQTQGPDFELLAARQANAGAAHNTGGSYNPADPNGDSDPSSHSPGGSTVITGGAGTGGETAVSGDNADTTGDTGEETANAAGDETQTAGDADQQADQTDGEAADTGTETAANDTNDTSDDSENTNGGSVVVTEEEEEEEEEVVVAEVDPPVKPGCENPYNKRGKIKRKCR